MVKNLHAVQETQVRSLSREDSLKKGMVIYPSIPWTEEPGGLQSLELQSRTWLSDKYTHTCVLLSKPLKLSDSQLPLQLNRVNNAYHTQGICGLIIVNENNGWYLLNMQFIIFTLGKVVKRVLKSGFIIYLCDVEKVFYISRPISLSVKWERHLYIFKLKIDIWTLSTFHKTTSECWQRISGTQKGRPLSSKGVRTKYKR